MRVAIASGKGGTGKTFVATNLAVHLARAGTPVTLVDCDVEAPNAHLFLDDGAGAMTESVTVPRPRPPESGCPPGCTACRDACRFGAIRIFGTIPVVDDDLCHGCGACRNACPAATIGEVPVRVGTITTGLTDTGIRLITGRMDIGRTAAPEVIRAARARAGTAGLVILDAPPGAACSAVATVHGADHLVLVTEPTSFGVHDLELMLELARALDVPTSVVVNRVGAGAADVDEHCRVAGVPVIARIPFDRDVAQACAQGHLVVDQHPQGPVWFGALWRGLRRRSADPVGVGA